MTSETVEPLDGLDTPALATSGLVAAIATFAMIVGLQAAYLHFEAAQAQKNQIAPAATSSASLLAEQRAKMNRYGWIDRQNNVVAIPIDRAIELTAKELRSQSGAESAAASTAKGTQDPS